MKIAFVYDAVYPWEKGGAQKRIWELARRLADDHEVHYYGMKYWDGPRIIERKDVILHGVCEPRDLYIDGRRSIPQALYFTAAVTPALFREDFDIIDCQEFPYFPVFTAKLHELIRGSNLVVTWYEVWDDYWYDYLGAKGVFGKGVERVVSRLSETIIPISSYIEDDLHDIGRTEGNQVVENGVDFDGLKEIPAGDLNWDILYFGRLSEHKNVDLLIEAVDRVSTELGEPVSCGIIGDGPERENLEEYTKRIGIENQVEFLGFVEADEDVMKHLKASRMFVLPSIREGFPNTILEANACGVPSIVVDHPENGSTAVVEDGVTGFITEVAADAIAKRILDLLRDEEQYQAISEGAQEFGRNHDWDVIVDDLERKYLNTLE